MDHSDHVKVMVAKLGNPLLFLKYLASCHNNLLGYGTFGPWGGGLREGEVVCLDSLKLFSNPGGRSVLELDIITRALI